MSTAVLIVEDNVSEREVLRAVLEHEDMAVTCAGDGVEALQLLAGGYMPQVMIVDYSMPRMSGPELIRVLQAASNWKGIPVLGLSGDPDATKVPGVRELLEKPATPFDIAEAVKRLESGSAPG